MNLPLVGILSAAAASWLLTPWIRKYAQRNGFEAATNERTIHTRPTPNMGGLALFAGFWAGILIEIVLGGQESSQAFGFLAASTVILAVGMADDTLGLTCYQKLGGQVGAAGVAVVAGLGFESVQLPFLGAIQLGWSALPFSMLWIVAVTNAINLIDGLDGLAVRVSIVVGAAISVASFGIGNPEAAVASLILIGALLGFLPFNRFPARIFLGDSGSLFLGFAMACFAVSGFKTSEGALLLFAPILILAIPLTDTVLAVFRRVSNGRHPFSADREHLHHRLLEAGMNHSQIGLLLSGVTVATSTAAVVGLHLSSPLFKLALPTFVVSAVYILLSLFISGRIRGSHRLERVARLLE